MPDSINYSWNLACNKMYIYIVPVWRSDNLERNPVRCSIDVLPINSWTRGTCIFPHGEWNRCPDGQSNALFWGLLPAKTRLVRIYCWLRHVIGIISPTEGDTIWANLMSIIEMKLPHPTALLHPSRIHPLASGIEVVVLSEIGRASCKERV